MRLVPDRAVLLVAVLVVAGEVAVAGLLALSHPAVVGFVLAATLLVVFTAAIVAVLRRGTIASCPCFGASAAPFGRRHLVRNGALLAVAGAGTVTTAITPSAGLAVAGVVIAIGIGALTAAVVVLLDDVVYLFTGSVR
jgi:hypothetical protein